MLSEHGIVIDDGVFVRLADDRFLVHTTSGGADRISASMDEWLQCEWVDLDVVVLPVTTQWAVMTVSGPQARDLIARLCTDIDLTDFPHMTLRSGADAGALAQILREAGAVPIGIEALMILRTEKGYLHIGVDTDGTTLPGDVGMAGPIAKKTSDFIGRRSLLRAEAMRDDRLQLVGLLSECGKLPVGAQVLAAGGAVPGPIDGHVTSSVDSPALGRPIALALVRRGRERIGETIALYDMGKRLTAVIVDPVFVDRAGEKLRA